MLSICCHLPTFKLQGFKCPNSYSFFSYLALLLAHLVSARSSNRPSFPLDPVNIFAWRSSVKLFFVAFFSLLSFLPLSRSSGFSIYNPIFSFFPSLFSFLFHLLFCHAIPHVLLFYFLLLFSFFPFHIICSSFSLTLPPYLFDLFSIFPPT